MTERYLTSLIQRTAGHCDVPDCSCDFPHWHYTDQMQQLGILQRTRPATVVDSPSDLLSRIDALEIKVRALEGELGRRILYLEKKHSVMR